MDQHAPSPGMFRTRPTAADSKDGTGTNARSTPCGKTSRCGACACMTPPPLPPRSSMPWSEPTPGSFLTQAIAAPAAATRASCSSRASPLPRGRVPDTVLDSLLVGTSEAVTNALLYGDPPVTVRIWATPDRVVVHVHDHGPGPANPLAGLIPPSSRVEDAELGLWLTHQRDIDVALIYDDGFTVRLCGGTIPRLSARAERVAPGPRGGPALALGHPGQRG